MIAHVGGVPVEELTTFLYGASAGWALLYLCGRVGAVADRVARRQEDGYSGEASSFTPEMPRVESG
jgi:hypothetical protein